jgi:chemotaxis protein MotB
VAEENGAQLQPIIIKKIKKGGGARGHSSAWKVAYADFVTAMMAFFMLLWLLNVTTEEQKSGVADYFAPTTASTSKSGSGGLLGGKTIGEDGAKSSGAQTIIIEIEEPVAGDTSGKSSSGDGEEDSAEKNKLDEAAAEEEEERFETIQEELPQMLEENPALADMGDHLLVDMTPEGLRIQLIDQEGRSMFESGSARMNPFAGQLLTEVSKIINNLPNQLAISGHTDAGAVPVRRGYGNWELSADRANTSRIVMEETGIDELRMNSITGRAATELLIIEDPFLPANRRISIVLLREANVLPPKYHRDMDYANGKGR